MINDETQEVDLETSTEETEASDATETESETEETKDWKAEAKKWRAEVFKLKKEPKEETQKEEKTDGFGYDMKAYLKASGIKSEEFAFVKEELKKFGGDLDSLIDNEYFQAKLEKHRAISKTTDATPKGKRTGNVSTDSVDYWSAKPFEEVPHAMRGKVLEARIAKEKGGGIFYNS